MAIDEKGLQAACEAYRTGGPVFEVSMRAAIRAYLKATKMTLAVPDEVADVVHGLRSGDPMAMRRAADLLEQLANEIGTTDEVREVVELLRPLHNMLVYEGWVEYPDVVRRAARLLEQLASRLNGLEEWVRKRAAASSVTLGEPPAFHVVGECGETQFAEDYRRFGAGQVLREAIEEIAKETRRPVRDECDD